MTLMLSLMTVVALLVSLLPYPPKKVMIGLKIMPHFGEKTCVPSVTNPDVGLDSLLWSYVNFSVKIYIPNKNDKENIILDLLLIWQAGGNPVHDSSLRRSHWTNDPNFIFSRQELSK